jgi:hypothetical protein
MIVIPIAEEVKTLPAFFAINGAIQILCALWVLRRYIKTNGLELLFQEVQIWI